MRVWGKNKHVKYSRNLFWATYSTLIHAVLTTALLENISQISIVSIQIFGNMAATC